MDINEDLSEFYGILLGDGCISKYKNQNRIRHIIRIDGNSITEEIYYKYIKDLIKKIINKEVKIKYRNYGNNIFIYFCHMKLILFLNEKLNFPYGKKNGLLKIPKEILKKEKNINALLKGFFDTDGCIYFTKNNSKLRNYPIIELSTHDINLLKQIKNILDNKNFNVKISHYKDSLKLHGKKNVLKWMKEIGSSNIDKYSKFIFWRKFGYCPRIDELPLKQRLKKINGLAEI